MKTTLSLLSLLALLVIAVPSSSFAEEKAPAKSDAPAKEKAKSKYTPLYAQVDSITDSLLTIKGDGADTKFVINAETKISKDKKGKEPAKASDVKVGQWVGGSYTKGADGADGANTLHSLHLDVDQSGGKGKKKDKAK